MSGKGDGRRPAAVDTKTFEDNWRRTFASPDDKLLDELNAKLSRMVAKSQRDPAARHAR